jgi:hypothetical protein
MENKTTTAMVAVEHKPNLQRVTKNINNWIEYLGDDVKIHQHESSLTIRHTLTGMTINEMIKFHGAKRSTVMAVVDLQLVRFLKSINVGNTLTDFQQQELVMTLVDRYPHETLNDFLLMFRMARQGYFGPLYNRIDITVISEYMGKYLEIKAFERENLASSEIKIESVEGQKKLTPEQYEIERQKWYEEKIAAFRKLSDIDEEHKRKKRGMISVMTNDNPRTEAEYQKFKNEWYEKRAGEIEIKKQSEDDTNTRGSMDGNVDPGSNENVSVSQSNGSGNVEPIQRTGSEHREQSDVVPS